MDFEKKVHQRKTVSRVPSIQTKIAPAYPGPDELFSKAQDHRQVHSHEPESSECVNYDSLSTSTVVCKRQDDKILLTWGQMKTYVFSSSGNGSAPWSLFHGTRTKLIFTGGAGSGV